MAVDLATQRRWLEQWKAAGPALEAHRSRELRQMSAAQALAAADALLALGFSTPLSPSRRQYSGLVEQQALLHRRARK